MTEFWSGFVAGLAAFAAVSVIVGVLVAAYFDGIHAAADEEV